MNADDIRMGLSYDDVLLVPQQSGVESRSDVDTTTEIAPDVTLSQPVISANMDTVTEVEMAQAMADAGGCGIIHRFMDIEEQAEMVSDVDGVVGGCVGIDEPYVEHGQLLAESGADFVCVDVAHGHMERCVDAVTELSDTLPVPIMAGNVATADAAKDLIRAGAESIKVGVGPGSVCKTREVAGVGVPQFTAVSEVAEAVEKYTSMTEKNQSVSVIADGGITKSGDTVKALMAGADAVMCGSLLGGCDEAPGEVIEADGQTWKSVRGMASEEARKSNPDTADDANSQRAIEGVSGLKEYKGTVEEVVSGHMKGVRSGLSYCGGHSLDESRETAEFVRVTPSTIERNGSHGVFDTK